MNAEQQEEQEVLQSIFPDTFSGINLLLLCVLKRLVVSDVPTEWQLKIDGDMITINLNVTLPTDYPNEVPEINVDCARGKYPEVAKLKAELIEEVSL